MNTQDIMKLIDLKGESIMPKIITEQLAIFDPIAAKMKADYDFYLGNVPVKKRSINETLSGGINNKLPQDYAGDIVDTGNGYFLGVPIKIKYDGSEDEQKYLDDFAKTNNVDLVNESTGRYAACCGYASRLCYIDLNGDVKIMNTLPWETCFIINTDTDEAQYAFIVYDWSIVNYETGKEKKTRRLEWYDKENVSIYVQEGKKWILDNINLQTENGEIEKSNPAPHTFDFVPLIQFKNNENLKNDFYKVIDNINAMDSLLSDAQNELEQFRAGYMAVTGGLIDEEERSKAKRTGVFNLIDPDAKIDFLKKELPVDYLKEQRDKLNENIYKFAKSVDMNNEKFVGGGPESGESRKWRLMSLEFKTISKERNFSHGLLTMYKILMTAWNKGKYNFDYLKLSFQFIRSLPQDLLYATNVNTALVGTISDKTRLTLMPFIKNADDELKLMAEEKAADPPIDFNTPAQQYDKNGKPIDASGAPIDSTGYQA